MVANIRIILENMIRLYVAKAHFFIDCLYNVSLGIGLPNYSPV